MGEKGLKGRALPLGPDAQSFQVLTNRGRVTTVCWGLSRTRVPVLWGFCLCQLDMADRERLACLQPRREAQAPFTGTQCATS